MDDHREPLLQPSPPKIDVQSQEPVWTAERRDLWQRIERHDFEPDTPLNFTHRLARDHGWSLDEARGAVAAYRRFCFLALVSPTPVTPSEVVDEVWHQHLIYSRDYWDRWCGQTLRAQLHHDPTPGGAEAQALYRRQYAETLALHERFFGPPSAVLWPATHLRFAGPRYHMTDRGRWFIVPKPAPWIRRHFGR
ncbi:MAG TPA: hypothetical protein VFL62_10095 [Bradyrhizobium sp.]|uniref:glycine-rich domain-containing protein n=1 Tax=Bradyrhizobium sp. TaxID=376 RepID=UPI002D7F41C6|nr:hypothetical protein [Bradyrhizobium sp.]HET7886565.1 hypothetical protein [Bradyrhizobium sp.]